MSLLVLGLPVSGSYPSAGAQATAVPGTALPPADDTSAVELLRGLPADTVVLAPAQTGPAVHRRMLRARKLTGRTDLAVLSRRRPASRLVLAACLVLGSEAFRPAEAAAAMDALDTCLSTTALLDRVGGLEAPVPSIGQHALGVVPGTRFLVDLDGGTVRRVGARLTGRPLSSDRSATTGGMALACASGAVPLSWPGQLVELLRPEQVEQLPPVDGPEGGFWGTARWAELTVLRRPAHDVLVELRDALPFSLCPSCERPAAGPTCVFCGLTLHHLVSSVPTAAPLTDRVAS